MERTIAVKRAELLKEWVLAQSGNNENYYYSTLFTGIPDGDPIETVVEDLKDGEYDEDIDDALDMYKRVRERYQKDGFPCNGHICHTPKEFFDSCGIDFPERITKTGDYSTLCDYLG